MTFELGTDESLKITAVAAADLSGLQYCFVKLDSSGKAAAIAADTDKPIGILQNAPKSGQEAEIAVSGGSKIKGSAAMAVGIALGTSAAGTGVARVMGTDVTKYVLGTIISATGAANEIGSALISLAVARAV